MTQPTKGPQPEPGHTHPVPVENANKERQLAEENEVAGRHMNSGQKDHKGAR